MKASVSSVIKRAAAYIIGLFLITVGINISKMSALGISPVSSIPRACEVIWGFTLGTTSIIVYCILVLLQILVLRKKFKLVNLLGIPLTFAFGWMVDLTGTNPDTLGHLLLNFPRPSGYAMKLVYLAASLVIIGFGVFLYLRAHFIPLPAEGLAGALSEVSGKAFGDCKTAVDCSMILIALVLQLIFLGGFSSFTGDNVVVREGTILAAVGVGQMVKLFTKLIGKPLDNWIRK